MRAFHLLTPSVFLHLHALAAPSRPPPPRVPIITTLPSNIYTSSDPTFAGEPIFLSSPPPLDPSTPGPGRYAISYTPYTSTGHCKPLTSMTSDLHRIRSANFTALHLHSTDCSFPDLATTAASLSLQLLIGIHIDSSGPSSPLIPPQLSALTTYLSTSGSTDSVDAVILGSESLSNDYISATDLAALIAQVRGYLVEETRYTGPVTTAERLDTLLQHAGTLCPALDLVAVTALPFLDREVAAHAAGRAVRDLAATAGRICPASDGKGHKPVLMMEMGWPAAGRANGVAIPGDAEQRVAVSGMARTVGSRGVFSSFEDEVWREEGDYGIERHWGMMEVLD